VSELFNELRERLLRAGVARRHVRRYLVELSEHLADVTTEEERAGRSPSDAGAAALVRLGSVDSLSKAMIGQRRFQSWLVRAPWAMFGLTPLVLLAGAYFIACLILWSGWQLFLPGSDTPFVRIQGVAIVYFGVGKLLYFGAPVVIGWGTTYVAVRQRFRSAWPTTGLALIAIAGAMAHVQVSRPAGTVEVGHVSMTLTLGPSIDVIVQSVSHAAAIFLLVGMPYFMWLLGSISGPRKGAPD
jgi:hypothetical protein